MSRIRSKWTGPEREFVAGHPGAERGEWLPHRPDFVWLGAPVFVESGFWHADLKASRWDGMPERWREHLFRNLVRDRARDGFWAAVSEVCQGENPFAWPVDAFPWLWGDTEGGWL